MGRAVKKVSSVKGASVKRLTLETCNPESPRRTAADGLSRLPRAVREKISLAIEDGATWKTVAAIAAKAGLQGVQAQNVTNYRKGAHREWLARQERMDAIRRDSESTAEIVRHYAANGGSPAEAGLLAASEILSRALAGMGPESLQILLADDPKAIFGITRELARVTQRLEALRPVVAEASQEETQAPALTPEERERKMKEIFGIR